MIRRRRRHNLFLAAGARRPPPNQPAANLWRRGKRVARHCIWRASLITAGARRVWSAILKGPGTRARARSIDLQTRILATVALGLAFAVEIMLAMQLDGWGR